MSFCPSNTGHRKQAGPMIPLGKGLPGKELFGLGFPKYSFSPTCIERLWGSRLKCRFLRTSLVVQWLKRCLPNAGDQGLIPGQETRPHMPQLRVCMMQLKILRATTGEKKKKSRFLGPSPGLKKPGGLRGGDDVQV